MAVKNNDSFDLFNSLKESVSCIDPVYYVEKNLKLDGKPFRLHGNGYKPFADIFRYIGIKSLEPNAKPVILVKGRQVGATTMASALEMYFMTSGLFGKGGRAPIRIIHAFPSLIHVFRYSKEKLNTMISSAVQIDNPKKPGHKISIIESKIDKSEASSNSLQYKQFEGGNFLKVESTGLDGDRLRGVTADVLMYDEVQDVLKAAIANTNKSLTTSTWGNKGIQVYFGTPKQRSSEYYKMWMSSNQQYYHLGCESCQEYFLLYTPGSDEWMKIWIHGFIVKCPHCGHEQDKREASERGKWVSLLSEEEQSECRMIGFHINQFYMPYFTREEIDNERPENSLTNTERAWQNEVLGEFYAGEMGPITPEEIMEKCADKDRAMRPYITAGEERKVFAGFDWGKRNDESTFGKEESNKQGGQSYSTVVILTEDGPGRLLIDFATMLKRNDFEYKKEIINEMMRKYSITQAVGDIGYAQDLTEVMQREYGDRFLASNLLSKVNGYARVNNDTFPHVINVEREYHMQELFTIMKKGVIRFPYKDYERISWLVSQCSSMEVKTTINQYKEPVRRFVKGATPNDGFMALLNAYIAYKYYISNGFKDDKANVLDPKAKTGYPMILGKFSFR